MAVLGPTRSLQRRYGLSPAESRAVIAACRFRRPLHIAPLSAAGGAAYTAFVLLILCLRLLDRHGVRFHSAITSIIPEQIVIVVVCAAAGLLAYRLVQRELVLLIASDTVRARQCLRCRYPLHGLPPTDGRIPCPECGLSNPSTKPPANPT